MLDTRLGVMESDMPGRRGTPWAGAITFVWYGAVIGVRSSDGAILETVVAHLPPGARLCDEHEADVVYSWTVETSVSELPMHVVSRHCCRERESVSLERTTDLGTALGALVHDAEFRVAMHAPDDVFIHAAAVAWGGRVVILPGHSFAGKTTLASELVRLGAPYYSDEYAIFGADGRVRPFPRALALRDDRGQPQGRVTAEELGGTRGGDTLPAGSVILTQYVAGAAWEPREMTRGEIILALLQHSVAVRAQPVHTMGRIVRSLGDDVIGLRGDRGDARSAAREILDRLRHTP